MTNIQAALAAHCSRQLSRARLMREVTWYGSWHVPSEQDDSGSVGLRMLRGSGGEWWLMAFADATGLGRYAASTQLIRPDHFIVVKGSSLFRNMPGGAAAVAFDVMSPHAVTFQAAELALLRQYGVAFEVEAALARTSKREDPLSFVRDYDGFRLLRHRQSGQFAVGNDPSGRQGVAVFTTEDALEAYLAQSPLGSDPSTERLQLGGAELFARLAPTVPGLVVNPAGPVPIAIDAALAQAVVAARPVEPSAPPTPEPAAAVAEPSAVFSPPAEPAAASAWSGAAGGRATAPGLFGRRQSLVPEPKEPPLADARRQHMILGRELLPELVARDGRGLVERLRSPGGAALLGELWRQAAGNEPAMPPTGLEVVGVEELGGTVLLVVQFPQARAMLEGHAAAISVGPTGNRYFLFERSTDDEEAALVERTAGGRVNMGFIPVELSAFVAAVCEKLGLAVPAAQVAPAAAEPPESPKQAAPDAPGGVPSFAAPVASLPAAAEPAGGAPSIATLVASLPGRPGSIGDRVSFEPSHVERSQIDAVERHIATGKEMAKQLNDFGLFVGACRLFTSTHAAIDPGSRMVQKGLEMLALGVCVAYQAGDKAKASMWLDGYHAALIMGDREKMAELAAISEATIRAADPAVPDHVMRYICAHQQLAAGDARHRETLCAALEEQPRVLGAPELDDYSHVALLSSLLAAALSGDEQRFNEEMKLHLRFHHLFWAAKPPKERLGGSLATGALAIAVLARKHSIELRVASDYVPAWLVR